MKDDEEEFSEDFILQGHISVEAMRNMIENTEDGEEAPTIMLLMEVDGEYDCDARKVVEVQMSCILSRFTLMMDPDEPEFNVKTKGEA